MYFHYDIVLKAEILDLESFSTTYTKFSEKLVFL